MMGPMDGGAQMMGPMDGAPMMGPMDGHDMHFHDAHMMQQDQFHPDAQMMGPMDGNFNDMPMDSHFQGGMPMNDAHFNEEQLMPAQQDDHLH